MNVFDFFKQTKDVGTSEIVLEYLLLEMHRWGKVSLHAMNSGHWWCAIDLAFAGAKIEVKSESNVHKTPSAATQARREKLQIVIEQFKLKEPPA